MNPVNPNAPMPPAQNFALVPSSSQDEETQLHWALALSLRDNPQARVQLDGEAPMKQAAEMVAADTPTDVIVAPPAVPGVQQGVPPPPQPQQPEVQVAAAPAYYSFSPPEEAGAQMPLPVPSQVDEERDVNAPLYADLEAERAQQVHREQVSLGTFGLQTFMTPRKEVVVSAIVDAMETRRGWFGGECKVHKFHLELETGQQLERKPATFAQDVALTVVVSPADQHVTLRLCRANTMNTVVATERINTALLRMNEEVLIELNVNKNRLDKLKVRIRMEQRDAPYLLRVVKQSQLPLVCHLFDEHTNEHLFTYDGGYISANPQSLKLARTGETLATTRAGVNEKSVFAPPLSDVVSVKQADKYDTATQTNTDANAGRLERSVERYTTGRVRDVLMDAVRKPDGKNWTAPTKIGKLRASPSDRLWYCADILGRPLHDVEAERAIVYKEARMTGGVAYMLLPRGVDARLSILAAMVGAHQYLAPITDHPLRVPRNRRSPRPRLSPHRTAVLTRVSI